MIENRKFHRQRNKFQMKSENNIEKRKTSDDLRESRFHIMYMNFEMLFL